MLVDVLLWSRPTALLQPRVAMCADSSLSMSYRELQQACKAAGLPAQGKTEALRERLFGRSVVGLSESPLASSAGAYDAGLLVSPAAAAAAAADGTRGGRVSTTASDTATSELAPRTDGARLLVSPAAAAATDGARGGRVSTISAAEAAASDEELIAACLVTGPIPDLDPRARERVGAYVRELLLYNRQTNVYSQSAYVHLPFHVADSVTLGLLIAELAGPSSRVLDLGSGSGLPSVLIACVNPGIPVYALESKVHIYIICIHVDFGVEYNSLAEV